ncbi:MAG: copper homeostasis protein CutC [Planctomycetaceae bacterium]|nr:copper homeostasis protein CutC [Planctomycetaceae bacterium]
MTVQLEVCIDSFASAVAAQTGGADRLEVCGALASGGTTPSYGLVEQCVEKLGLPVMMMIRPHDGGFVYQSSDIDTMLKDIRVAKSIGAHGVVFGVLTSQRELDQASCQRLIDATDSLETTFHRAFDLVPNPLDVLNDLERLGFDRVLTSGQQTTALAGYQLIEKLTKQADSVEILAGAGITSKNALELVGKTGVREIHASASVLAEDQQARGNVSFGAGRKVTCSNQVRAIKNAVTKC